MNDNLHPAVFDYLYSSEPDEIVADYLSIERLTEPYEPVKMKIDKLKGFFLSIKSELEKLDIESHPKK